MIFVLLRDFLFIVLRPAGISLLYELLQLPFSYKLFYLLLQVSVILYVMPMIFVKTAVFSFVMHVGRQV